MAKEQAPYMPFFGRDFYGDVNVMAQDLEEQGAYIRLSWLCWQEGTIPADVAMLAMICSNTPVSRFKKKIWPKLYRLFEATADGRLVHRKIESIRDGKEAFRKKCSEAGKIGNDRRWGPHRVPDTNPIGTRPEPDQNPNRVEIAKPSLSFSSSLTITETTKNLCSSGDERGDGGLELVPQKPERADALFPVAPTRAPAVKQACQMTPEQEGWWTTWWAEYWRHVAKKAAREAFRKQVRTAVRFEQVMAATRAQRAEMLSREAAKRPHGATWLHGERWADETVESEPAASATANNEVARILAEQFRVRGEGK